MHPNTASPILGHPKNMKLGITRSADKVFHANLSFEQAPPISVPLRFMLTAPWFGVAAGLVIAFAGPEIQASRWTGSALAVTHLIVAGFMLQAMTGALLQMVPVMAGGNVWRPRLVAGLLHPLLIAGAIALVTAFLGGVSAGFLWAVALFLPAGLLLVGAIGSALWRTPAVGDSIRDMRLAIAALAVTLLLGLRMAEALGRHASIALLDYANAHAAWGLGAWALVLLVGVSYQVVPMFQLTAPYPPRFTRGFAPGLLVVAVALSVALWLGTPAGTSIAAIAALIGLLLAASFALVTLRLQQQRRRRLSDTTLHCFRLAMVSLIILFISAALSIWLADLVPPGRLAYWFGVWALVGGFMSAIQGMLYKIVPFLNWLHLQKAMTAGLPPNMKDMIPVKQMVLQFRLHLAALAGLLLAAFWPGLAGIGGLLLAVSNAWLAFNLIGAARLYHRHRQRIASANRANAQ